MNHQQKEDIRQMRAEGHSYAKIADRLGISENTVKSYCRRNNLGGVAFVIAEPQKVQFADSAEHHLSRFSGKSRGSSVQTSAA